MDISHAIAVGEKAYIDTEGNLEKALSEAIMYFCNTRNAEIEKYIKAVQLAHRDYSSYNRGIRDMGDIIIDKLDYDFIIEAALRKSEASCNQS